MSRVRCFWIVLKNGGEAPAALHEENRDPPISLSEQTNSSAVFGLVPPNLSALSEENREKVDVDSSSPPEEQTHSSALSGAVAPNLELASRDAVDGLDLSFGPSNAGYRKSSLWDCASISSNRPRKNVVHTNMTGSDDENISFSYPIDKSLTYDSEVAEDTADKEEFGASSKERFNVDSIFEVAFERARRMQRVLSSNFHPDSDAS